MRQTLILGLMLVSSGALAVPATPGVPATPSLCLKSEQPVFSCAMKHKILSVCASRPFDEKTGTLQYRFGTPDKVELQYPATPMPATGYFWSSSTMYSGGGEFRIRFKIGANEYLMFDSTIRTGFGAGGNRPQFSAGVVTKLRGKITSVRKCSGDAHTDTDLLDTIPKEDFDDDARP